MIIPIYRRCIEDERVRALLSDGDDIRLYPFSEKDDDVVYPYVVWQGVSGLPENYLGTRPDVDTYSIQIDVYADTATNATEVAEAIRYAIETHSNITRYGSMTRDSDSKRYRYSFDVDWMLLR
jgi:Protein of unknown function (DUF3168).